MSDSSRDSSDSYGFERDDEFDHESYEQFMSDYISILTSRLIKWQGISTASLRKSRKLKRYIRKGIPSELRPEVWMKISSAIDMKNVETNGYNSLASTSLEKAVNDAIKADIPRTYPENIYFRDTNHSLLKPLANVLTAYANHNPDIGYCQGLNYITGMILLITKNEADSFWLLSQMLDKLLPDFYSKGMSGLRVECHVLGLLIKSSHPELYQHLVTNGIDMELVVTKWFICLFMDVLPVETVLRIWDCLFFEGCKILLRVAYTLIVVNKDQFLEKSSFTEIYEFFKEITHDKTVLNCHEFMKLCFTIPKSMSRARVNKLRVKAANMLRLSET